MTNDSQDPCRVMAEAIWDADQTINPHTKERLCGMQTQGWDKEAFIADLAMLINHTVVPEMVELIKQFESFDYRGTNMMSRHTIRDEGKTEIVFESLIKRAEKLLDKAKGKA